MCKENSSVVAQCLATSAPQSTLVVVSFLSLTVLAESLRVNASHWNKARVANLRLNAVKGRSPGEVRLLRVSVEMPLCSAWVHSTVEAWAPRCLKVDIYFLWRRVCKNVIHCPCQWIWQPVLGLILTEWNAARLEQGRLELHHRLHSTGCNTACCD